MCERECVCERESERERERPVERRGWAASRPRRVGAPSRRAASSPSFVDYLNSDRALPKFSEGVSEKVCLCVCVWERKSEFVCV